MTIPEAAIAHLRSPDTFQRFYWRIFLALIPNVLRWTSTTCGIATAFLSDQLVRRTAAGDRPPRT
ncbi:MAG: hypothetical protein AAGF90_17680, partial [Pseudomonadota bacterium]